MNSSYRDPLTVLLTTVKKMIMFYLLSLKQQFIVRAELRVHLASKHIELVKILVLMFSMLLYQSLAAHIMHWRLV